MGCCRSFRSWRCAVQECISRNLRHILSLYFSSVYSSCVCGQSGDKHDSSALPPSCPAVIVAGEGISGFSGRALALVRQGFAVKCWSRRPRSAKSARASNWDRTRSPPFTRCGHRRGARGRGGLHRRNGDARCARRDDRCRISVGEAFRERFSNPYAVIHRADVHGALLEGARALTASNSSHRPRSRTSSRTRRASRCSMRMAMRTEVSR